jgi:hypothetical protein
VRDFPCLEHPHRASRKQGTRARLASTGSGTPVLDGRCSHPERHRQVIAATALARHTADVLLTGQRGSLDRCCMPLRTAHAPASRSTTAIGMRADSPALLPAPYAPP